jgi:aryl-alcohol dehydrogenase-like predicted oxidoreductase
MLAVLPRERQGELAQLRLTSCCPLRRFSITPIDLLRRGSASGKALTVQSRPFGSTGLRVSILGFGAGHVGGADVSDNEAGRILNAALDLGVTLFDTARAYGRSEERIGRYLSHRRSEYVLSTKGGYGADGTPDWTGDAIARGIDLALARLRTEVLDIFHLHSCDAHVLAREDIQRALDDALRAGKIRVAAYSGENEPLDAAIEAPVFRSVQCSVNLADQRSLAGAIPRASARGLGVIGKRPLANAPWRFSDRPHGDYAEVYWERLQSLRSRLAGADWPNLALRFSAFAPGVNVVIVGTKSLANLEANVAIVREGPLDPELAQSVRDWFKAADRDWRGQI